MPQKGWTPIRHPKVKLILTQNTPSTKSITLIEEEKNSPPPRSAAHL